MSLEFGTNKTGMVDCPEGEASFVAPTGSATVEPVSLEQLKLGGIGFLVRTLNEDARTIADTFRGTRRSKRGAQVVKRKDAAAVRQQCEAAGIPAKVVLRKSPNVRMSEGADK